MPSAAEISKLFGFVAKETPKSTHLFNAAMGAGAKGVYNVATGRDLTDGMVGWGIMGAAAGVGLKTYKGMGVASDYAKAEARLAKAGGKTASFAEKRAFASSLRDVRQKTGLAKRGMSANKAAQKGGVVGASAATAERHTTMAANQPVAGPVARPRGPVADFAGKRQAQQVAVNNVVNNEVGSDYIGSKLRGSGFQAEARPLGHGQRESYVKNNVMRSAEARKASGFQNARGPMIFDRSAERVPGFGAQGYEKHWL